MYYYWFENKDIRKKEIDLYANYSILISYNVLRKDHLTEKKIYIYIFKSTEFSKRKIMLFLTSLKKIPLVLIQTAKRNL